jgi:lipopolysaccharide biosynthesis regulator YciM
MLVVAGPVSVRDLGALHQEAVSAASATLGIAALIIVLGAGLGNRSTQTAPKRCSACGHGIASFQTRCPECGSGGIVRCDD